MAPTPNETTMRPRDLALLLLASGELLPRRRARDQQADLAGLQLKRRLLDRLAALDPEPEALERTLMRLVEELGAPTGPTRALAVALKQEWELACVDSEYLHHLLEQATRAGQRS
jgi:hypothetical protein